jgi:hypothetical protein
VANEINSSENIKNAIVKYEKMFEQLKKITGSDNVEDVILTYSALEEEMFSMYSYIQTQNAEIEAVIEADMKLKADMKKYSEEQAIEDELRSNSLNKLQTRLQATKMACAGAEAACVSNQEATREIAKKIQNLFFKLQCDQMENPKQAAAQTGGKAGGGKAAQGNPARDTKLSMLSGQGATESNVLDYLGAVENRAVDIITEYLKVSQPASTNQGDIPRSPTPGPKSPFHWPMDPFVVPPELHEDAVIGNDDDHEARPIDLNHFKEKLSRRGHNHTHAGHGHSSPGHHGDHHGHHHHTRR